jgi:hypothetical protein
MKPVMKNILVLLPLLALGACATGSYCEGQQDYQRAQSVPVLQPAGGLKVPESDTALKIPPPPAKAVPFGEVGKDEDGDDMVVCLDKPPALPPLAPEPVAPAAAPAPEKAPG